MANSSPTKVAKGTVPTRSLKDMEVSGKILEFIPQDSAVYYKIVPIAVKDGVLEVGATDPNDLEARDALNFISSRIGMPYKLFLISEEDFKLALKKYEGLSGEVTRVLSELKSEIAVGTPPKEKEDKVAENLQTKIVEDAPVTKIVATILNYASEGNASDIHIEPTRENVRVRFRVDGQLNTSLTLPSEVL
ncbi:MAG: hypothetical protein Q7S54_00275, partial [bacterium]|nr:hypothetical protein [bacterium]